MSKIVLQYAGYMDSIAVEAAVVTTGWYPGNVGILSSGKLGLYAGSGEAMFLIVDKSTEVANPPSAKKVTVLYGQGKIQIVPDSVSDWTNVFVGPLAAWTENAAVYATNAGKLTPGYAESPDASSGSKQVGKVVTPPSAANNYTLEMLLTL